MMALPSRRSPGTFIGVEQLEDESYEKEKDIAAIAISEQFQSVELKGSFTVPLSGELACTLAKEGDTPDVCSSSTSSSQTVATTITTDNADSSPTLLDWSFLKTGQLFGRDQEILQLQEIVRGRIAHQSSSNSTNQHKPQLLLVSGASGLGKTQLVQRALQNLSGGYFLLGKFDQLQAASEPYGAFVAALTQLALQIMEQQSDDIEHLKTAIQQHVGMESCYALCSLVPTLGEALGICPTNYSTSNKSVSQHDAKQDRLATALTKLFATICETTPVILVADDMQWCDPSSIQVLEELVVQVTPHSKFTVVGVCRDNEVPWGHLFAGLLRRLEDEKQTTIVHLKVSPLDLSAISELLAYVLGQSPAMCGPLAERIHDVSQGNAYLIQHLVKALYQEGILTAQQISAPDGNGTSQRQWLWDDQRWAAILARKESTLNIVNLISRQIHELDDKCQKLLQTAACLGAETDIDILSLLLGSPPEDLRPTLQLATETSMMVELLPEQPGRFAFAHDRVQEAAYKLIPEQEHPMAHVSIGRTLLEQLTEDEIDDHIFLVANQLISGRSLLKTEIDKTATAQICVQAGKKASQANDFDSARHYFDVGTQLLPLRPWRDEYHLSLELFSSQAESECCAGDFTEMDATIQQVLLHSRCLQDKMRANLTSIYSLGLRSQFHDAIREARTVLASFGVRLPPKVELPYLIRLDMKVKKRLKATTVDGIYTMPGLESRDKMAAMSVLNLLPPYVFCAQPEIFPFVPLLMVNLTLKYGISDFSGLAFCYYAVGCIVMNDFASGYKYGNLALRLLDRCEGPQSKISPRLVFHVYGVTFHWKQSLKSTFPALRANIPVAIDAGDHECALITAYTLAYVEYAAGTNLALLDTKLNEFIAMGSSQSPWIKMMLLKKQMVDTLRGKTADPKCAVGLTSDAKTDFQCYDCWVQTIRLQLGYHFGDMQMALAGGKGSRVGEDVAKTSYYITFQLFYDGMASLEQAHFSNFFNRQKHISAAKKVIKRMRFLAKECPENNLHKQYLLEGELCALKGKLHTALEMFSQAHDHASDQGVTQLQALALERASVALRRLGKTDTHKTEEARGYLERAIARYDEWGASALVLHLQKQLNECIEEATAPS